ncbi:MAG TPA: ATP-binding protein [Candidatus Elarobacter sp.]
MSRRQRNVAYALAAVLTAIALAALPYLRVELPAAPSFIAATGALIVVIDLITAYLLFRDAAAARLPSLAALACGYTFTGLTAIAHTVVFPDNWTAPGVSVGSEAAAWMWTIWHIGFAVTALAYAVLSVGEARAVVPQKRITLWPWMLGTLLLAAGAIAFALVAGRYLPQMQHGRTYHPLLPAGPLAIAIAMLSGGLVGFYARRGNVVSLWLAVGCCGFAFETLLMMLAGERYTVGWYLGRVLAIVASSTVLATLLQQTGRLISMISEAAAVKSRFLATMSHELRTPIHAVVGLSELMLETPLTTEAREYARTVRDSAEALVDVINDILDFSKIEAGGIVLERAPFSPGAAVEVVADILTATARVKGITLIASVAPNVPPAVLGDAHRVRQVLLNLVGNAVKFTERGGVSVDVSVAGIVDERTAIVQFTVSDTGPGIAPELGPSLFEPFRQADAATTRRYGGSGLGLSIAKHLVDLMGGELTFDSVVGAGTTFRFVVPLEAAVMPAAPDAAESGLPLLAPLSVLIVDDNAVNRNLTLRQLRKLGCAERTQTAENGREAIAAVAGGHFDLVLMDCEMPEVDGFAATRAIRAAEAQSGRHVTIVAMTANAMEGDREACLAAGMDGYLAKPVQLANLRGAIQRHTTLAPR